MNTIFASLLKKYLYVISTVEEAAVTLISSETIARGSASIFARSKHSSRYRTQMPVQSMI